MNTDKDKKDVNMDNQTIVEEKITKVTGEIQIRKYIKGKLLGKGGFAKCYEMTSVETKRVAAGKVVAKNSLVKSRAKQKLISEIKIHKSLHHPGVVGFEHYFEDSENVYIMLEICTNQSLNELLKRRKRMTELEVQCYLVQMIKSLKYLHSHRIIHRDLKLGNLFLSDKMEVKIGDFGLATKLEFEGERKRTVCGTPNYIAPEILEGKQGHSYEVDIWSLGVIAYTLIIGKPPFETSDVKTTYKRIKMNNYSFPESAVISDAAKSFITEILQLDPTKRPNLDQMLAHDFFNQGIAIPKVLPTSTLACPPSLSYIRQFMPDAGSNGIVQRSSTTQRQTDTPGNKLITERSKPNIGSYNSNTNRDHENAMMATNRPLTTNVMSNKEKNEILNSNNMKDSKNFNTNFFNSDKKLRYSSGQVDQGKSLKGAEVWVKKWVDYSSKYGLGYSLSNLSTGVFFNDNSKIVMDTKGDINYVERRQSDKQEVAYNYNINKYPPELQKKITLLQHFRNYLDTESAKNEQEKNKNEEKAANFVYVKKWMRTRHAIMFRLSNKVVQVCFQDHTEIILSSETKVVTYKNKKGERQNYPLNSALESPNQEMTKRLKYTKDILTHMLTLNANQATGGTANGPTKP